MTLLHTTRVRRRRLGVAAAAAGLLATLLTAGPAVATPDPGDAPARAKVSSEQAAEARSAIENGEIPPVDAVVHSDNVEHLTNIPKDALKGTNSDLAFQGKYAFAGNYDGFRIFDISNPRAPKTVSQVLCPGSQNDISVSGDLLFLSTDSSRNDNSCNSVSQPATEKSSWEGMKIFDISDKANPKYVAAVETACGSHTHTIVPERRNVYIYVSSYSPSVTFPDCQPPHDGISVIKVPRKAPEKSAIVNFPVLFPGEGPDGGGNPGSPTNPGVSKTTGCHDITVLPSKDLAAGACMGDGILFDIEDPEHPRVIDRVQDNVNFAFWHSATFNQRANKVVFTDELGGGGAATCNAQIGPNRGADGIYDIVGKETVASWSSAATTRSAATRRTPRTAWPTTAHSSRSRAATSWSRPGTRAASRSGTSRTPRSPRRSPTSSGARSARTPCRPAVPGRRTTTTATSTRMT